MAGFIYISRHNAWSARSSVLDAVVELTRQAVSPDCQKHAEAIFSEVELTQVMALDELDNEAFNCFCHATRMAYERFGNEGPPPDWSSDFYPLVLEEWKSLLTQLRHDPRFECSAPPDSL